MMIGAAVLAIVLVSSGPPTILVTRQLLEAQHLQVGDDVTLSAAAHAAGRTFRIGGAYEPVPDPMRFAQQPLEAQLHLPDLLDLERADHQDGLAIGGINVALTPGTSPQAFAEEVSRRLPGLTARPTSAPDERTATFLVVQRFHLAIAVVTMVGSGVFLLALMVMLVDERRETVATLRLMGFTRRRILAQVLVEGAVIVFGGALCGVGIALASQSAFNHLFQWRYDTSLIFLRVTPRIVAESVAIALPIGILASTVASWTLLRRAAFGLVRR